MCFASLSTVLGCVQLMDVLEMFRDLRSLPEILGMSGIKLVDLEIFSRNNEVIERSSGHKIIFSPVTWKLSRKLPNIGDKQCCSTSAGIAVW